MSKEGKIVDQESLQEDNEGGRILLKRLLVALGLTAAAGTGVYFTPRVLNFLTRLSSVFTSPVASAEMSRRWFLLHFPLIVKDLLFEWQPGMSIPERFSGVQVEIINQQPVDGIRLAPHPFYDGINALDGMAKDRYFKKDGWKISIITINNKEDALEVVGETPDWIQRYLDEEHQRMPLYEALPIYSRQTKKATIYILPSPNFATFGSASAGLGSDLIGRARLTEEIIIFLASEAEHYQTNRGLDVPSYAEDYLQKYNGRISDGGFSTALIYCHIPGPILH